MRNLKMFFFWAGIPKKPKDTGLLSDEWKFSPLPGHRKNVEGKTYAVVDLPTCEEADGANHTTFTTKSLYKFIFLYFLEL